MKTITICDKEYKIDCNAFTYVKYNSIFKTGIIKDAQKIQTFIVMQKIYEERIKQENPNISKQELENQLGDLMIDTVDDFIEIITKIAWIMIYSANNEIEEYEKWLKSISRFSINDKWIVEVAELAVDCFC